MPPERRAPEPTVSFADENDVHEVRELLREYAAALPFPLDFQGFEQELEGLPGGYAPPGGALIVARSAGAAVGCVALRSLGETACELKRLYVRPAFRGGGLGRQLVATILDEARRLGYLRVRLDTVPGMESAQALYEQLGFREIEPYTENPVAGTRFLELCV